MLTREPKIDFYDFKSHADLGSATGEGSSTWGWVSPEGREFIAIAQADGAAFAEVTSDGTLSYLGRLPQYPTAEPIIWREIRGWSNYILIGSVSCLFRGVDFLIVGFSELTGLYACDYRRHKTMAFRSLTCLSWLIWTLLTPRRLPTRHRI